MHDPHEPHFLTLKRILRYLHGTLDHGLYVHPSSVDPLVAYSDVTELSVLKHADQLLGFLFILVIILFMVLKPSSCRVLVKCRSWVHMVANVVAESA